MQKRRSDIDDDLDESFDIAEQEEDSHASDKDDVSDVDGEEEEREDEVSELGLGGGFSDAFAGLDEDSYDEF